MDLAKIERAKNQAAVKALEAYIESLREQLTEEEVVTMHHNEHVHTALLLIGKTPLTVVAHWRFSIDPAVAAKIVALKEGQGKA